MDDSGRGCGDRRESHIPTLGTVPGVERAQGMAAIALRLLDHYQFVRRVDVGREDAAPIGIGEACADAFRPELLSSARVNGKEPQLLLHLLRIPDKTRCVDRVAGCQKTRLVELRGCQRMSISARARSIRLAVEGPQQS